MPSPLKIAPSHEGFVPHLIRGSLDPPDSASQTASRSIQPLLHSLPLSIHILYNGCPFPQKCLFLWGFGSHLIHDSLGPTKPITRTVSRSVQPFLHSSPQSIPILYNEQPISPKNCSFPWGIWTPFRGPPESLTHTSS